MLSVVVSDTSVFAHITDTRMMVTRWLILIALDCNYFEGRAPIFFDYTNITSLKTKIMGASDISTPVVKS